jgi:hypothetical protein
MKDVQCFDRGGATGRMAGIRVAVKELAALVNEHIADSIANHDRLLDAGLGPRDAAARLVIVTGKPRRHLYQLALSLQRSRS